MKRALRRFWAFWGEEGGLSALLLLLLFVFFLAPLLGVGVARLLRAVALSLVLVSGAASISGSRLVRCAAGAVVALALVLRWLEQAWPDPKVEAASTAASLLFLITLTGNILHRVFRKGPVTAHRIGGAIVAYFLFGLCWAQLYQLIDASLPGAFSFPAAEAADNSRETTLTYFSFVTLTTLGYGDVTAVHPVARMFAILQALVGQLYPATLLARLVSLEILYRDKP